MVALLLGRVQLNINYGIFKDIFKEVWAIKPKTVIGFLGGLGLDLSIGLNHLRSILLSRSG